MSIFGICFIAIMFRGLRVEMAVWNMRETNALTEAEVAS